MFNIHNLFFSPVNPDDLSVVLRAKRKIPEGEYITRSYVPAVYGVPKRRQDLSHDWGVICHCERCSDVTEFGTFVSAFKCGVCGEGLILPQDTNGWYETLMIINIIISYRLSMEVQVLFKSL